MTLDQATILVVDDEPVLRLTFGLLLRQLGATAYEASDGVAALAILRRERVDLVLTDKQMPNMDGMTLLRSMAADGLAVPSILFISGVDPESHQELQLLRVVQTLAKPIHPEDLIRVLTAALEPLTAVR